MQSGSDSVREFFDAEAGTYGRKHYHSREDSFIGIRQRRILEVIDTLDLSSDTRVLDAGCGPGLLSLELAARGFSTHSTDLSPGMLSEAIHNQGVLPPASRPSLVRGNIERLPYRDASFDLVCSAGVIEYLKEDETVLREFWRVLKPGGHLVLPTTKRGAPVNALDPLVEALKRRPTVLSGISRWRSWRGEPPVQPRYFQVRTHRPEELRQELRDSGFQLLSEVFFYFTPWPHPLEKVLPGVSQATEQRLANRATRLSKWLAAGYITLSVKLDAGGEGRVPQVQPNDGMVADDDH
jgi:ubiquinone/menaquinone biosynthesis C-methylase UbiE